MTEANAVEAWQGDDPHTNTMLSPNRSDIGAGVLIGGDGTALNPGDALSQYIVPVTISAPHPNGDVYHKGRGCRLVHP
jgi:hypothetical protein